MGPLGRRARRHTKQAHLAAERAEFKTLLLEALDEDPEFAAAVGEAISRASRAKPKRTPASHPVSARQIRDRRVRRPHG